MRSETEMRAMIRRLRARVDNPDNWPHMFRSEFREAEEYIHAIKWVLGEVQDL